MAAVVEAVEDAKTTTIMVTDTHSSSSSSRLTANSKPPQLRQALRPQHQRKGLAELTLTQHGVVTRTMSPCGTLPSPSKVGSNHSLGKVHQELESFMAMHLVRDCLG